MEEKERGWRPELGGRRLDTTDSSTSSCDTPCCWWGRGSGHPPQR